MAIQSLNFTKSDNLKFAVYFKQDNESKVKFDCCRRDRAKGVEKKYYNGPESVQEFIDESGFEFKQCLVNQTLFPQQKPENKQSP